MDYNLKVNYQTGEKFDDEDIPEKAYTNTDYFI